MDELKDAEAAAYREAEERLDAEAEAYQASHEAWLARQ